MCKERQDFSSAESFIFFYLTLKTGDAEKINHMFGRLQTEQRALIRQCFELAWYMRGGATYDQIMQMTPVEKEIMNEWIEKHMKDIEKHNYPVY